MAAEEAYRNLAAHLDRLPGGFPPSETGAELRLLETLFTPEEADLATYLTLEAEEAPAIAQRAGLPAAEAEQRLAEMARKGLIFSVVRDDGPARYRAAPWIVGIYEFQVNNLTPDLLRALGGYFGSVRPRPPAPAPPGMRTVQGRGQVRTIPIGKSVETRWDVLPYEQLHELLTSRHRFAVAPCICRRMARLAGKGCDAPEESCLSFDEMADYCVRAGVSRYVDRDELMVILARADEHNLVLQPSNSQEIDFVCSCCGCCCGVLGDLKRYPKPAEVVISSFRARYAAEECNGCLACLDRCQMEALTPDGDRVAFNADRCIGCGLCTTACPTGALKLERRPDASQILVPVDMDATMRLLSQAQAEAG